MALNLQQIQAWLPAMQQALFYLLFFVVMIASKEIVDKFKIMWLKRKAVIIELIGSDLKSAQIVVKKKDEKAFEYDGMTFFINPLKAIDRKGLKIYTYVVGNAFSHNYARDSKDYLKKMIQDCEKEIELKDKKGNIMKVKDLSQEFHNVFDEAYRVDARMLQETLYNAHLANQAWDEIFKFFKSKNILTYGIIALIGIAICIFFSWNAYEQLTRTPVCVIPTSLTV